MIKECDLALLISLVVQRNSSRIDAVATLYCVFPLESSAMRRLALLSSGIDAAATLYCVFPLESSDINKYHWQVLQSRISFAI